MNELDLTQVMDINFMRTSIRLKLNSIRKKDKNFNHIIMEKKTEYIKDNHPDYFKFVNSCICKLGEITLNQGDCKELDNAKNLFYSYIYL